MQRESELWNGLWYRGLLYFFEVGSQTLRNYYKILRSQSQNSISIVIWPCLNGLSSEGVSNKHIHTFNVLVKVFFLHYHLTGRNLQPTEIFCLKLDLETGVFYQSYRFRTSFHFKNTNILRRIQRMDVNHWMLHVHNSLCKWGCCWETLVALDMESLRVANVSLHRNEARTHSI